MTNFFAVSWALGGETPPTPPIGTSLGLLHVIIESNKAIHPGAQFKPKFTKDNAGPGPV